MKYLANRPIILASESPRRRELLSMLGVPFGIEVSMVDEKIEPKSALDPTDYAGILATQKAEAVAKSNSNATVIGADTIVYLDNEMFSKPRDEQEAKVFLTKLSGKTHTVVTAVAIVNYGKVFTFLNETEVTFYELDEEAIDAYIATGDALDKAGGYGIQSGGALLIEEIKGDFYSVMGLPIAALSRHLETLEIISLKRGASTYDRRP